MFSRVELKIVDRRVNTKRLPISPIHKESYWILALSLCIINLVDRYLSL